MADATAVAKAEIGGATRLAFLDVVRALAALAVVVAHFRGAADWGSWESHHFKPGTSGVMTFFICSGFIIPSAIERSRSIRRFWVGRLFRLWPAYLAVAAMVLLVSNVLETGYRSPTHLGLVLVVRNLLMLNWSPGPAMIVEPAWTLGFELVFYVCITALFAMHLLKRSLELAALGFLGTLVAAGLPPFHAHPYIWRTVYWFDAMLVGMVVYDAWVGRFPKWVGWAALGGGYTLGLTCFGLSRSYGDVPQEAVAGSLTGSFLVGYATFAVVYALRDRRMPRVLRRIGVTSYSLYLVHQLVIYFVPDVGYGPASAVLWIATSLVVAELGYRIIESPANRFGHRVGSRLGPKPPVTPAAAVA